MEIIMEYTIKLRRRLQIHSRIHHFLRLCAMRLAILLRHTTPEVEHYCIITVAFSFSFPIPTCLYGCLTYLEALMSTQ